MSKFLHEQLYRSVPLMARIREQPIVVCGAGAVGANLVEALIRSGFEAITVIDRDRVEEHNLSTQPYERAEVGALKAKMLQNKMFRALGVRIEAKSIELDARNAKKLLHTGLIVDAFDNSTSRAVVTEHAKLEGRECLHVGLAGDYAEVIWNDRYRVPSAANDDVCDYPLARNLIMLAVAVAAETIVDWVANQQKRSHTITLRDFAIASY
jgi:molybdopterin/thiamine biosynthesis adenylyltransferase